MTTRPATGGDPFVEVSLAGVPRSGTLVSRDTLLDGGVGVIQRIENRASGIPSLLDHARNDLAEAEQAITEADHRIGQPFRHATALTQAEDDLARVETQLAAMQRDIDQPSEASPAAELATTPGETLTVDAVRAHRPALGVRPDPARTPTSSRQSPVESVGRDSFTRGL